jgi:pyridoxal phosphate enzyme (YggS family)
MSIADNIKRVQEKIAIACAGRGISSQAVTLVAVSKTIAPERIKQALAAGIEHLGENYLQEARVKISSGLKATWHFIGHLQSNKANAALELFDIIQSIDRLELLQKLAKRAETLKREAKILVQINLVGEAGKSGLAPNLLENFMEEASKLSNIKILGLMAIPPLGLSEADSRSYYRKMFALKEKIEAQRYPVWDFKWLSLGMSDDYHIAIEEGANMVRVGTAIFGQRV